MDRFALPVFEMRAISGCIALVAFAGNAHSADWVARGDQLDRQFKSAEALAAYQQAEASRPDDPQLQRKIAKQYVEMVLDAPSHKEKVRLAELGYGYAQRAKRLASGDADVRLTVAIAAGRLAFVTGEPRRKIELSGVTRDEAQAALRIRPRHALAWHCVGRWHYEMARLNPLLRLIAESIYGGLPQASQEEAIRHLAKAVELEPGNALFRAELGRAYLAAGRKDEARRELQKSLALPLVTRDDIGAQGRAREALAEL